MLFITTRHDAEHFHRLLGNGPGFGMNLAYAAAPPPMT
jgi:glucose-1-phosphate thymidylyltransferase